MEAVSNRNSECFHSNSRLCFIDPIPTCPFLSQSLFAAKVEIRHDADSKRNTRSFDEEPKKSFAAAATKPQSNSAEQSQSQSQSNCGCQKRQKQEPSAHFRSCVDTTKIHETPKPEPCAKPEPRSEESRDAQDPNTNDGEEPHFNSFQC